MQNKKRSKKAKHSPKCTLSSSYGATITMDLNIPINELELKTSTEEVKKEIINTIHKILAENTYYSPIRYKIEINNITSISVEESKQETTEQ